MRRLAVVLAAALALAGLHPVPATAAPAPAATPDPGGQGPRQEIDDFWDDARDWLEERGRNGDRGNGNGWGRGGG
jgi:ABC-type sugar transport system substrate-binding protein